MPVAWCGGDVSNTDEQSWSNVIWLHVPAAQDPSARAAGNLTALDIPLGSMSLERTHTFQRLVDVTFPRSPSDEMPMSASDPPQCPAEVHI